MNYRNLSIRLASLFVLLGLVLSAAACDNNSTTATTPAAGSTPATMMTPGAMGSFSPIAGAAKTLNASGATFPKPLYDKQFADFGKQYGVTINYAGGGSGKGKSDISAGTVDFAGSDSFMSDTELATASAGGKGNVLHVPAAIGAIVMIYNLPGFSATDKIKLTGANIADIYLAKITKWNDPAILANNPNLQLPAADIVVVHRSDGSGTSANFSNYLAKISPEFSSTIGVATAPKWKDGQLGGNGNQGVAQAIQGTAYSIGYVELNYAVGAGLPFADLQNKSGKFITPSGSSVSLAAQGGSLPDDLRFTLNNPDNAGAYPIVAATWLLVRENQTDQAKAIAVVNLLNWELTQGQSYHGTLGYAPLPANMIEKAQAQVKKITVSGKAVMP